MMSATTQGVAVAMAMLVLSACASRHHVVDRAMILPPGAILMDVPSDQRLLMAAPIRMPDPVFPAHVGKAGIDITVCVSFVVADSGAVEAVEIVHDMPECKGSTGVDREPFEAAVREAVSGWSFLAAAICRFPDGVPPDDDCKADGASVEPVSIRLSYLFSFRQQGGRRMVGAVASP